MKHIIEPVVDELGYKTVRADQIPQPGMITDQVITHLLDDDLVVADLTHGNPNVFYELAIRHATRKPVVSMIEEGDAIPFDINQSRTILVNHRDLDSVYDCKNTLKNQIQALGENPSNFFTPVSMTIDLRAATESGDPNAQLNAQMLSAMQNLQTEVGSLIFQINRIYGRIGMLETGVGIQQKSLFEPSPNLYPSSSLSLPSRIVNDLVVNSIGDAVRSNLPSTLGTPPTEASQSDEENA